MIGRNRGTPKPTLQIEGESLFPFLWAFVTCDPGIPIDLNKPPGSPQTQQS
jgi:hypothetical protein